MKKMVLIGLAALLLVSGCGKMDMKHESANKDMKHESSKKDMKHDEMTGMKHSAPDQAETDSTDVKLNIPPSIKSNMDEPFTIQVNDKSGNPVNAFEVEHEKLMHLIVVSNDLGSFQHIHPQYKGNGQFSISINFPSGGVYKLFADFVPKGKSKVVKSFEVDVKGTQVKPLTLEEDKNMVKLIDGKMVTLSFDHLMAGMDINMTFNIKDAETKKPISDLQPYLGAVGHVVAISSDTNTYLHVHPLDENAKGPEAKFMTNFPKAGIYKIWGQFQHNNKVFIVPFVVKVP